MAQTCVPSSSVTCTPNVSLSLPVLNSLNWNTPLNNNFSLIDSLLSGNAILPGLKVSGPLSFPGNLTAVGGQNSFSLFSLDNIVYIDGNKYPATDAGFAAALTAAGTNGTIILPPNTTISLTSVHALSTGQRLFCESPTSGFNYNIASSTGGITINQVSDVRISGCTFTYQTGNTSVALFIQNTASRIMIDNNRFTGPWPGTVGGESVIFVGDRSNNLITLVNSDIRILDNFFNNFLGNGINVLDFNSRVEIARNLLVSGTNASNLQVINAQESDASTTITALTISENIMYNALGGDCVQVQQLNGNQIQSVTIEHNQCIFTATANGFSAAGIAGLTQVGNTVNANGNAFSAIGNAAFEFANVVNSVESGDDAILGTQSQAFAQPIFTVIQTNGNTTGNSFTGNSCSLAYTGSSTMYAWYLAATTTGAVSNNNVTGNTCDLTGSTGKVGGIFLQTGSVGGALVQNNTIQANTIKGANITGDCGICIEQDTGTLSGTVLANNQLLNFHLQNGQNFGGQTAGFLASTISPTPLTTGNAVALTADWTCGTGGTVASCTSATIIGSTTQPMTFALPVSLQSYTLQCDGVVGQATAATANQWNLLTATNGATNVTATYDMYTAATAKAGGAVTDQASTTTTFQIAPSWTLGGTATKMPFHIWARIEAPSLSGTTLSVQLLAPTVGDLVTIYRGTTCTLY